MILKMVSYLFFYCSETSWSDDLAAVLQDDLIV